MSDGLHGIFTEEALRRLQKSAANSPLADFRYRVFTIPPTSTAITGRQAPETLQQEVYRRRRERWSEWIGAAFAAGLFRDPHGAEMKSRLTGIDDDGFRSALSECMSCWALAHELGLAVQPRPSGRGERVLDFVVVNGHDEVNFEVKSPRLRSARRLGLEEPGAFEDYRVAVVMAAALRSANRQFAPLKANVLLIALPEVGDQSPPIFKDEWPWPILRALYGQQPVGAATGNASAATGNFLKRLNGAPRFTRVSAVGVVEDSLRSGLRAVVVHNPYSERPLDSSTLAGWRQFEAIDGHIRCFSCFDSGKRPPP